MACWKWHLNYANSLDFFLQKHSCACTLFLQVQAKHGDHSYVLLLFFVENVIQPWPFYANAQKLLWVPVHTQHNHESNIVQAPWVSGTALLCIGTWTFDLCICPVSCEKLIVDTLVNLGWVSTDPSWDLGSINVLHPVSGKPEQCILSSPTSNISEWHSSAKIQDRVGWKA